MKIKNIIPACLTISFCTLLFLVDLLENSRNVLAQEAQMKTITAGKTQAESAKILVDKICSKIAEINGNNKLSQVNKMQQITLVIDSNVDAEWIARFILGKNYRTMDNKQKETFINIYHDFLLQTYAPKMQKFSGNNFKILQVAENNKFFIVKTEFNLKDGQKPVVEFRIRQKNQAGEMVIVDFIAEGISFIETQRAEFGSAIAKEGVEKFLTTLVAKVKK
jgi:phospholipid transport system substrate-binding protein